MSLIAEPSNDVGDRVLPFPTPSGSAEGEAVRTHGVLVVTPIAVYRDAIVREVARSFPRTQGIASLGELGAHENQPHVLVIVVAEALDDAVRASMTKLHASLDRPKLVLLAGAGDGTPADFLGSAPLAALLPQDSSLETLVEALRLIVRTDAAVIPRAILERTAPPVAGLPTAIAPVPADMPLSPREVDVIVRLTHGRSNKEIARDLSMAEPTVRAHIRSILVKLKLNNRTQATVWAMRHGLDRDADEGTSSDRPK